MAKNVTPLCHGITHVKQNMAKVQLAHPCVHRNARSIFHPVFRLKIPAAMVSSIPAKPVNPAMTVSRLVTLSWEQVMMEM
jgi:hypothetical protein